MRQFNFGYILPPPPPVTEVTHQITGKQLWAKLKLSTYFTHISLSPRIHCCWKSSLICLHTHTNLSKSSGLSMMSALCSYFISKCLWEFLTVLPEASVRSDVRREGSSLIHPKGSVGLSSGLCAGRSSCSTPRNDDETFLPLQTLHPDEQCWLCGISLPDWATGPELNSFL